VTRTTQNITNKFQDTRSNCDDYNDYLLFSNNDWIVRLGTSDRRHACLEADNSKVGDHKYWEEIYGHKNDECGLHFFHYLALTDLSDYNPREIPMTEWKKELKDKSIDPVTRTLIDFVKGKVDQNGEITDICNKFQICEFYTIYEAIIDHQSSKKDVEKLDKATLSKKISKILNIKPLPNGFVKGGVRCRGYQVTVAEIMDRVRCIMCDPDYSFIKEEDYEEHIVKNELKDD
jgi:hypothetical protein